MLFRKCLFLVLVGLKQDVLFFSGVTVKTQFTKELERFLDAPKRRITVSFVSPNLLLL